MKKIITLSTLLALAIIVTPAFADSGDEVAMMTSSSSVPASSQSSHTEYQLLDVDEGIETLKAEAVKIGDIYACYKQGNKDCLKIAEAYNILVEVQYGFDLFTHVQECQAPLVAVGEYLLRAEKANDVAAMGYLLTAQGFINEANECAWQATK